MHANARTLTPDTRDRDAHVLLIRAGVGIPDPHFPCLPARTRMRQRRQAVVEHMRARFDTRQDAAKMSSDQDHDTAPMKAQETTRREETP